MNRPHFSPLHQSLWKPLAAGVLILLAGLPWSEAAEFPAQSHPVESPVDQAARPLEAGRLAIRVLPGEVSLHAFKGLKRVVVGDSALVSVKALPDGSLLVAGKQRGKTSLLVWADGMEGQRIPVEVISDTASRLAREMQAALGAPEEGLRVEMLGEQLVITGQISSETQAEKLKLLIDRNPRVVSLVKPAGAEQMIAMEVRFLEVKKNALEGLGVQWSKTLNGPMVGIVGDFAVNKQFRPSTDGLLENGAPSVATGIAAAAGGAAAGVVSPFSLYFGLQSALLSVIKVMEQSGDAIVLAEPVLSCRSGGRARFLAGGEIPLPVTSALGSSSVQFKPYGIRFEVEPKVTDRGSIAATITTELSTVDPSIKVGDLPAFLSRMTETQVNLRYGETLVMSGLISEEGSSTLEKVAGLGDIPILGALFRSKDFQEKRSEMVVFITPRPISPESELNQQALRRADQALAETRERMAGQSLVPPIPPTIKAEGEQHAE